MNQLNRVIDNAFNQSLKDFPVFCQSKSEIEIVEHMHAHNGYEFHFSLSSVGIANIEGLEYEFTPGKITIIRPQAFHLIQTTQTTPYLRVILSIDEVYLIELSKQAPIISDLLSSWFPNNAIESNQLLLNAREEAESVFFLLSTIEKEIERKKAHFELIVQARIIELFVILARKLKEDQIREPLSPTYQQLMNRVANYITEHLAEPLSTTELAATFHISRSYLHKLFKQYTDYSPHQYQILQRINQGKHLLRHSDESITSIAISLGFKDTAHFSRYFKEITGFTPSFYRMNS